MAQLNNNVLIVFGATGGLGRAVVEMAMSKGEDMFGHQLKLVAVSDDKAACEAMEKEMKIHTMAKDATDQSQVEDVFNMHKGEGIMGVINCIGNYVRMPMKEATAKDLMHLMQNEVVSAFNILKVGAPLLAEAGGGAMACVGAAVVHYGIKHHEIWAAAKGAVEAMHRNAAATYAPCHVRINCVMAGMMHTPASAEVHGSSGSAERTKMMYPMKRIAEPSEVAHALLMMVHPATTFTTGAVFPVDGGLSCVAPRMDMAPAGATA